MKFSEAWLREFVDPPIDRDTLLEQLTMAGLEVESAECVGEEFSGVVLARVESVAPHPRADKLSVCQVFDGTETMQVVCGAPNVCAGLVTAFARVGAVLPRGFEIKKAKLRGEESNGMLCSADELGVGDDADGIMELGMLDALGTDLYTALRLDDVTIDLDLTPNRGDCLSVRGLAREVGVLNSVSVSAVEIAQAAIAHERRFEVHLDNPAGCPRYLGRVIEGIDPGARSPLWLTERLRRSGLRSIDAVVDVTNYVMLELGQPMHAFDLDRLTGKIVVRDARPGEKLTMLDGSDVELDESTLLITDESGPVAIAGVMGGERSGVQPETRNVFLECAFFTPDAIAGAARRYDMQTDAAHRYERGVDFELQQAAMERATGLLVDIVGGEAGPVVEAVDPQALPQRARVSLRQRRLDELLGVHIDAVEVDDLVRRLDFEVLSRVNSEKGVVWTIRAPSHRFDIGIEADLVEEVCRIHGYNNVPSRTPVANLELRSVALERSPERALKSRLAAVGFQEVVTYSFIDPVLLDVLDPGSEALMLTNPMSAEQSVMRTNLLPGLVDALRANVARQQERVRIFELGLVFRPGETLAQPEMLGGLMWGHQVPESWHAKSRGVDFFDLKGGLEQLLAWSGTPVRFSALQDAVLHPGQAARVSVDERTVGRLGRLHPEIERRLDVEGVYVFEIEADALLGHPLRRYVEVSRYPSVRRDLAIIVGDEISASELESAVREAVGKTLVGFTLFDVYRGKGIDSNEKSVTVGLTLQDPSATLTDTEITAHVEAALTALGSKCGARLR